MTILVCVHFITLWLKSLSLIVNHYNCINKSCCISYYVRGILLDTGDSTWIWPGTCCQGIRAQLPLSCIPRICQNLPFLLALGTSRCLRYRYLYLCAWKPWKSIWPAQRADWKCWRMNTPPGISQLYKCPPAPSLFKWGNSEECASRGFNDVLWWASFPSQYHFSISLCSLNFSNKLHSNPVSASRATQIKQAVSA